MLASFRRANRSLVRLQRRNLANSSDSGVLGSGAGDSQSGYNARTLKLLERRKVTTLDIGILKRKKKPITMVTAYDYPSAVHVDLAGFDILLVGDSLGMVELEGGADCVKIEGGRERATTIKTLVDGGIAVMGHVGLRPQHISVLGGFRAQGRTATQAEQIIEDALAVEAAGAFAVVLECVPSPVAKHVTEILRIPTIGIGAGPETSGQVLVFHDLLGMLQHPHHAQHVPKFCRRYADVGERIRMGLEAYRDDVESRNFPTENFAPYKMSQDECEKLERLVAEKYKRAEDRTTSEAAPSEVTKVY
ncbi:hypothetical protein ATCC90586_006352 [Pythium insidiosum]|nr:hypothetical protein ATCC90586_006352 [Pythium insidiosum]